MINTYQLLFFLLVLTLGPSAYCVDLQRKPIGNYEFSVIWDEQMSGHQFSIHRQGKKVYGEGGPGTHFWIGEDPESPLKGYARYQGKDITKNGLIDMAVVEWNGGAHCYYFLSIYELSKTGPQKLLKIDGGSHGFRMIDPDHDGVPEIEFWDGPIDYLFTSFSESAQGRVVLKYTGGTYRVAPKFMIKPKLDLKMMEKRKLRVKADFKSSHLPYSFLEMMMELSYSGHFHEALKIADELWPPGPEKAQKLRGFKMEFSRALSESRYWRDFYLSLLHQEF